MLTWFIQFEILRWSLRLLMVLVVLRRRLMPVRALMWLSLIFFAPELAIVLYLLLGRARLGRRRTRQHRQVVRMMRSEARYRARLAYSRPTDMDPVQLPIALQSEQSGGLPIVGGNAIELLDDERRTMDRIVSDIEAASHHVHLEFYIIAADATGRRVGEALERASRRGVTCRVLADAVASRQLFKSELPAIWRAAGIDVRPMLPVRLLRRGLSRLDLRNHRKIAVFDGRVAYAGSRNIVDADYGHRRAGRWIDLMGRFTGPVVGQLQLVFLEDWAFESGEQFDDPELFPEPDRPGDTYAQTVPTGPSSESETFNRVILTAVHAAKRRLILTTPYLVPDEPMLVALQMAADRGVDVSVVLPRRGDHRLVDAAGRAYYEPLLNAGVQIHLFEGGMLHAKVLTVDDSFALLGSANMDIRSFFLNFEVNVLLYGPEITGQLRFAQQRYMSSSRTVTLQGWRDRPAYKRYVESAAALMSPLL